MKRTVLTIFLIGLLCAASQAKDYDIVDFGAKSDTTILSTAAIQQAIDQCSAAGGGRVVVPAGMYKTGTLVLKSHVDLHLETGATLFGSTRLEDYRPMKTDYVSLRTWGETVQLIFADRVQHVSISGHGTIDGRGAAFKKLSWNDEGITRPHLLRFIQSQDISIADVTLRNSGCWMQHYLACDRLQIRGIKVFNRNNYNNDALDLDGCHDVVVSDMLADSDDDAITLKSTSPRLCENIVIHDCIVSSHCNAIKLGTETNGGFRNINISNCVVKPSADQSTQFFGDPSKRGTSAISLEIVDGGTLENVHVTNIVAEGTESPIFIRLGNRARGYAKDVPVERVGTIRGVHLTGITVNGAGRTGSSITGLPGHPVEDVWLSDITIRQQGGSKEVAVPDDEKEKDYPEATMWGVLPAKGFFVRHARNINFRDINITTDQPDARPEYVRVDVE
ncbi:MAG: glycoside hydrolase [Prevotella sp.]|nr:glycoside hydrolase [Prevotella sp.]